MKLINARWPLMATDLMCVNSLDAVVVNVNFHILLKRGVECCAWENYNPLFCMYEKIIFYALCREKHFTMSMKIVYI